MIFKFKAALFFVTLLGAVQLVFPQQDYVASINQWHASRIERLKQPDGWLSLAGLYWLHPGENSFGSDASNDIRFPQKAAPFIGRFILASGVVSVKIDNNVDVKHDSEPVSEMVLNSDKSGEPTVLSHGPFLWYIIDRNGRLGVRLKNRESKLISTFSGIDRFPVDESWRLKAKLDTTGAPKAISVPSILGTSTDEPCPGALVFEVNGKEQRLYPIGAPGESSYFLIFADATSGEETYGAGRFLSISPVDENGETFIDFNKAYNPPCAFTPYATCPLPPKGNRLDISVTAGEKNYGAGH